MPCELALRGNAGAVRRILESGGMSESRGRDHGHSQRNDCDELLHGTSPEIYFRLRGEKASPHGKEIGWTHALIIVLQCNTVLREAE
jgi:hypothetical protein